MNVGLQADEGTAQSPRKPATNSPVHMTYCNTLRSVVRAPWRRLMCVSVALLIAGVSLKAQVASLYTFSQSAGSYSGITGGTVLWNNSFDDNVSAAQTIPAFPFNGASYTQMYVSSNGFITFGAAPDPDEYSPISSGSAYQGCIAPFATDLVNASSGTREVRWQTVGIVMK